MENTNLTLVPNLYDNGNKHFDEVKSKVFAFLYLFLFVLGLFANFVVIFIILVVREYKKSVTHWYVLQLAFADTAFLLTLPFKASQELNDSWIYGVGLCKAIESILFINYYSSIIFLMVMSVDRYIAVCHTLSPKVQSLRKPIAAYVVTVVVWIIAIGLSVPAMLYTDVAGIKPKCKCRMDFPRDSLALCLKDAGDNQLVINICYEVASESTEVCTSRSHETSQNGLQPPTNGSGAVPPFALLPPPGGLEDLFGKPMETSQNGLPPPTNDSGAVPPFALLPPPGGLEDLFGKPMETSQNGLPPPTNDSGAVPPFVLPPPSGGLEDLFGPSMNSGGGLQNAECTYHNNPDAWGLFIWLNFSIMFILPILVMGLCYGLIIYRLSQTPAKSQSKKAEKDRFRVTVMCSVLVVSFTACWVMFHANHIGRLLYSFSYTKNECAILFSISHCLAYLNSVLNPYLYSFLGTGCKRKFEMVRSAPSVQQIITLRTRTGTVLSSGLLRSRAKTSEKSNSAQYNGHSQLNAASSAGSTKQNATRETSMKG